MPTYDYQCSKCEHTFEKVSKIADRHMASEEACPECGSVDTISMVIGMPRYVDNHKLMTGPKPSGQFREVLSKIHESTPGSNLNDMVRCNL
jgi:putative FmdB family regulatory protein